MQHFILATLSVMWLLKQTCAQSPLYVKMFMGPEDKDLFYVEEGGSKDIECYVLGVESLTIDLKWSGPSVNESLPQKTSLNHPEEGRQRVGNWLHIKQFSDATAGDYTCTAVTSKPQDLTRIIKIAKSCEVGKFGPPSCTKICSQHCKPGPDGAKGRNCDHLNGTCLNSCQEGYTGTVCTEKEPDSLSTGAVVGITVAVVVVLVALVGLTIWKREPIKKWIQTIVCQRCRSSLPQESRKSPPTSVTSGGRSTSAPTSNQDEQQGGEGVPRAAPSSQGIDASREEPVELQPLLPSHEPQNEPPKTPGTSHDRNVPDSQPNELSCSAEVTGAMPSPPSLVSTDKLQELEKKIDENSKHIRLLEKAKSTDEAEIKKLKSKIEMHSKHIEHLEKEKSADRVEIERLQNEIDKNSKQIETLEEARRADEAEIKKLNSEIAKLIEERDRYKERCLQLEKEIDSRSKLKDEFNGLLNDRLNEFTKNLVETIDERNNVHEPRARLVRQSRQSRDVASQPVLEGEPLLREQDRKDVARRTSTNE